MSRNPLIIDAVVAVAIVILVMIIEPGVAVSAILALILFAVCAVGYLVSRGRRRGERMRRQAGLRRTRATPPRRR